MLDLTRNYFEMFGLPVGFIVDSAALATHYRELQRVVHPDRYAHGSAQEQRLSLQQATLVNEAYETLKDPLKRARYLLLLHGIDMNAAQETTRDTGFLMQQLELREALANAGQQDDPHATLDELMQQINGMIKKLVAQMAMQFESAMPEQLEQARESVRKMQFLNKLHAEAQAVEAELEDTL